MEQRELPTDPEKALEILAQTEGEEPEYLEGEEEAWQLSQLIDGLLPLMNVYAEKLWQELHPQVLWLLVNYHMAYSNIMKGGGLL